MNKYFLSICITILLVFIHCTADAEVSVILRLDRTEATLLDSVRMVVKVSGIRKSASRPVIAGLDAFEVIQGGTSSRVEIVNRKVSSGIDYSFTIQPKKAGTFTIGPAELRVKGKTVRSNTQTLTVRKPARSSGAERGPLFLSAGLSRKKVYVEEQTIYTLKLYRQAGVRDISLTLPEEEHLTFTQLGKPIEYQSTYNNRQYKVLEVRYALFSSREGTFGIRPARMNLLLIQPRRKSPFDLFDDPFFSRSSGIPKTLASEPLELEVRGLPEKGRPADFSGLVGTFNIDSKLEPQEVKAGESVTLTVILNGRGNVKRIPDLKMPELEGTKVYSDQPVLKEELDSKGLKGSKTMKWALVPEREGRYRIPPLSVSFFDTAKHGYRTIESSPATLSVLPGSVDKSPALQGAAKQPSPEAVNKKEVKELGHDILPLHSSVKGLSTGSRFRARALWFWLILLAPCLLYGLTYWGLTFRKKSARYLPAVKARKAAKSLARHCRKGGLSSSALISLIRDYLNDRFGLSLGSLTSQEAAEILISAGVSSETAETLRNLLQKLEDAVYTGKGDRSSDICVEIPGLIRRCEREMG